jgi:hypothetical protein
MKLNIQEPPDNVPTPQSYTFENFPVGIWMKVVSEGSNYGDLVFKTAFYNKIIGVNERGFQVWGECMVGYSFLPAKPGTKIIIEV